ncbi:MAG: sulfatase-like hydrolase/transferase [Halothiobacillaceae bacterium]|nr:sulfatase-like hydrolase/transferase [Halothiobacillaceae bacterium]
MRNDTPNALIRLSILAFAAASLAACGGGGGGSNATAITPTPTPTPVEVKSTLPNVVFILTDDHGYADVGAQKIVSDIKTPNIDALASNGVRMSAGYTTAPQCTPARSALMSGRYQQKFGMDDNSGNPFPLSQPMIAEKLKTAGYTTGMVGKWHLDIDQNSRDWYAREYPGADLSKFNPNNVPFDTRVMYYPHKRGFDEIFFGYMNSYYANFSLDGHKHEPRQVTDRRFRVDVVADAAVSFIERNSSKPFFLYVSFYAPHVPLEASQQYLDRFSVAMKERRRYALAMLSAVDDGVGRIQDMLKAHGVEENTLIFFVGDNGAPTGMGEQDIPISVDSAWDGSINAPWIGEKGMLSEGGIRTPFIFQWKKSIPKGLVFDQPVNILDAVSTIMTAAGKPDSTAFDGVDLVPYLNNKTKALELNARPLYWRFWNQSAIRKGQWKYMLLADGHEYLFDMNSIDNEKVNRIKDYPGVASSLKADLTLWSNGLKKTGLPSSTLNEQEVSWYSYYFRN